MAWGARHLISTQRHGEKSAQRKCVTFKSPLPPGYNNTADTAMASHTARSTLQIVYRTSAWRRSNDSPIARIYARRPVRHETAQHDKVVHGAVAPPEALYQRAVARVRKKCWHTIHSDANPRAPSTKGRRLRDGWLSVVVC